MIPADLSSVYTVRPIEETDIQTVYALARKNPLFYQHCPPFVTKSSLLADMKALPPNKTLRDKYYLGFWKDGELIAVVDLILAFPNDQTAFIGFFMVNRAFQGKGIGSAILHELLSSIRQLGYFFVRLGYAKGNPQSRAFWVKNGFAETGVEYKNPGYTVMVMERSLAPCPASPSSDRMLETPRKL